MGKFLSEQYLLWMESEYKAKEAEERLRYHMRPSGSMAELSLAECEQVAALRKAAAHHLELMSQEFETQARAADFRNW